MLTANSIHKNRSAVNQVTYHKSKQTIYESLAENQCVIPFVPMSPLPCKYRTVTVNFFSSRKKNCGLRTLLRKYDRRDRIGLRGKINSGGQSLCKLVINTHRSQKFSGAGRSLQNLGAVAAECHDFALAQRRDFSHFTL